MECRDIHTGFSRLYIAVNGRCLIKAFTISLACSVIPFCKQKRWENILALGHLVLKKLFSLTITLILLGKYLVQNRIFPSISYEVGLLLCF